MRLGGYNLVGLRYHGGFQTGVIFQGNQKVVSKVSFQRKCIYMHSNSSKGDNYLEKLLLEPGVNFY